MIATDTRSPMLKLRRAQLYALADAYKITYPKDCAATTLRPILEAQGINPAAPLPDSGEELMTTEYITLENGSQIPVLASKTKPHASINTDSMQALQDEIAVDHEEEVKGLEQKVKDLTKLVEQLVTASSPPSVNKKEPQKEKFFEFKKRCKEAGVDVKNTDKRVDLERKLKEIEDK